ncbi:MAG: hypothetical protein REI09_15405, partial [Candidatus Dactylopiibacterium sp.]|nr:hypothetical protein [Candidatus Dactylopiibacterium sp.]
AGRSPDAILLDANFARGATDGRDDASASARVASSVPGAAGSAPGSGNEVRIVLGRESRPAGLSAARVRPGETTEPGLAVLRIEFSEGALTVGDAYRPLLAAYVARERIGPDRPLSLWINVEPGDPLKRRAAFLRLAAVRNLLIDSGLPPTVIDARMLPGYSRQPGQTVFVGLNLEPASSQ